MHQSIYIATKTKALIDNMDDVIEISKQNTEHRTLVDSAAVKLNNDANILKQELSKFKI